MCVCVCVCECVCVCVCVRVRVRVRVRVHTLYDFKMNGTTFEIAVYVRKILCYPTLSR